jgi:hypothetical protein
MEESGSVGLDEFITSEAAKKDGWFHGVDAVCIVCVSFDPTFTSFY